MLGRPPVQEIVITPEAIRIGTSTSSSREPHLDFATDFTGVGRGRVDVASSTTFWA
jgi:hypothetical protein